MSSNKQLVSLVLLVSGSWLLAACTPGPDLPLPASTAIVEATAPPPTAAPSADSLARMQSLLERGVADGQVAQGGKVLLQTFARAQQALGTPTQQNTNAAKQQLLIMQLQIVQGIGAKTVDATFGQAVLTSIDTIARDYNLQLPRTFPQPAPPADEQNTLPQDT